jgi:hypothetical protein
MHRAQSTLNSGYPVWITTAIVFHTQKSYTAEQWMAMPLEARACGSVKNFPDYCNIASPRRAETDSHRALELEACKACHYAPLHHRHHHRSSHGTTIPATAGYRQHHTDYSA